MLKTEKSVEHLTISFPEMDYLGIWRIEKRNEPKESLRELSALILPKVN